MAENFWATNHVALLWQYGEKLKAVTNAQSARDLWIEMEEKRVQPDEIAYKFYIEALKRDKTVKPDEIENAKMMARVKGYSF